MKRYDPEQQLSSLIKKLEVGKKFNISKTSYHQLYDVIQGHHLHFKQCHIKR